MSENPESTPPPTPPPPPSEPPGAAPPPPPTPPPTQGGGDSSNRTVMLVLAYLGPLALIPFLLEKEDKEVQWHSKHGLVLTVAEIGLWLVLTILGGILSFLACFIFPLVALAIMVLHIYAIYKAVNGGRLIVPGVSPYADKF